jgi:hypothetical protein
MSGGKRGLVTRLTGLSGLAVALVFLPAGCTTSLHGSFVTSSYRGDTGGGNLQPKGRVRGESCQTKFLYVFPIGPELSTAKAIQAAKDKYEGTRYLADISIDDRTSWGVGYSVECITVDATAF